MSGEHHAVDRPVNHWPSAADAARRRAARMSLGLGAFAIVLGLATVAVFGSPTMAVQYVPLAFSVLVFGVPHGAVDHLVLPRARGEPVTRRALAAVGLLYLVVGGAYAVVWVVSPALAFALFILLTLVHWGQGDVYAIVEFAGADHLETRTSRVLTLVVRGGVPMLVPLVAFPDQYAFVAGTLVSLFDPAAAATLEPVFEPSVRTAVAVGFGTLVAVTLGLGYLRATSRGPWLVDAGETLGLLAFFALVPPILAIGLYFTFWHSVRHILRTMLVDDVARQALERGAPGAAWLRFARDAAPLTAGALVVVGVVALAVPRTPATLPDVVGLYLVGIALLTLPHVVVVSMLDREQGIWSVDGVEGE
nr:Brp/Blh family beta-carotene 15,15'-dioxygenase [Natronobeatus ordinarius]